MNPLWLSFGIFLLAFLYFSWLIFDQYLKPKCIVCKVRDGHIVKHKAVDGLSGCGGFVNITYHQKCLKDVIDKPEIYDDWIIFNLNSVVSDLKNKDDGEKARLDWFKKKSKGLQL